MLLPNWTGAFVSISVSVLNYVAVSEGPVISNLSIVECGLLDVSVT